MLLLATMSRSRTSVRHSRCRGSRQHQAAADDDAAPGGYFYAEVPLPGGGDEFRRFIYRVGFEDSGGTDNNNGGRRGTVPLQFGREVLAEVMDNPDIRGMCC